MPQPKSVNKPHAREWVAALRSGVFEQCTEALCKVTGSNTIGHCCLGVVSVLSGCTRDPYFDFQGYTPEELSKFLEDEDDFLEADISGETLPLKAQHWLGIDQDDPVIGEHAATHWNDTEKLSFLQIADLIEENWGLKEAPPMSQFVPEVVALDTTPNPPTVATKYAKRPKRYIVELRTYNDATGKHVWVRSESIPQAFKTYEDAEAAVSKNPAGFMGGDRRIRTK